MKHRGGSLLCLVLSLALALATEDPGWSPYDQTTFEVPAQGTGMANITVQEKPDVSIGTHAYAAILKAKNASAIDAYRKQDKCNDIHVVLTTKWFEGNDNMLINCSFDRVYTDIMTVAFFSGKSQIFVKEYLSNSKYELLKSSTVTGASNLPTTGNWTEIRYYPPSQCQLEDLSCHITDKSMGDGHDTLSPVMQAVPEIFYHAVCISCSGSQEIIVEEPANVTLSCKVRNVRPRVLLFWDEPFDVIPESEQAIPGKGCDGKHFDQTSDATALIDDRQHHWHVCCTAESTNPDKYTVSSPDVYIKYRPKRE